VEAALLAVPRDRYVPGEPPEKAYSFNTALLKKRSGSGEVVSSVSAPYLIAEMLGQAADALGGLVGRHVLEIGSGGYNASLLRELTGNSGSVTTADIDPEVTDRAAACLGAAGYNDITVVCADAGQPVEPGRRWDLIMVTAGAWDVPDEVRPRRIRPREPGRRGGRADGRAHARLGSRGQPGPGAARPPGALMARRSRSSIRPPFTNGDSAQRAGELLPGGGAERQHRAVAVGGVTDEDQAVADAGLYAGPAVAFRVRGFTPAAHVSRISLIRASDSDTR
jgi:protein-L-isoaspartate O-methyltransferase